jgi:hypothetical protein
MKKTDDEIKNIGGHPDATPEIWLEWFLKGWRACENCNGLNVFQLPPDTYSQDLVNNEDQKNTPDYLYRPNDFSVFHKMKSGEYTHEMNIERGWSGNGYQYNTLIAADFVPCTPEEFPELKRKNKLYYEYLSWASRPDGHGGSKGGTFEEFLARKKHK